MSSSNWWSTYFNAHIYFTLNSTLHGIKLSIEFSSHTICSFLKTHLLGPARWHKWLSPRLARPGSHMGAGSNPCSPASLPAPCLWPGKAVKNGPRLWDPAPAWETQKRLLASDWHSIGRCTHLGSESSDEDLPLCISAFPIKIK